MAKKAAYKRILLKLSGEAFMGQQQFGLEKKACELIAQEVKKVYDLGVEIGIVVGGGNIFRGSQASAFGFARTPADQIGLLATTINGIILQQSLSLVGIESRIMTAVDCDAIVEPYRWKQAMQLLQQGEVVIFVGGTGNPYFTTDSAAALRASEIEAEALLKATKVDGIYSDDPKKNPKAKKYEEVTYSQVLAEDLKVMDATAIALCRENKIPIHVFNLFEKGAMAKIAQSKKGGSLVS